MTATVNVGQLQARNENEEKIARETIAEMFDSAHWHKATRGVEGEAVCEALAEAAFQVVKHIPPSADRTVAIRKLREARMDANSAITHGGKY